MLISLSGLPGTGKSAAASLAAKQLGAVYVRIDSIEEPMLGAGFAVQGVGYEVARAVASDNLALGRIVIADCVNPWPLTRDAWRHVAERLHLRVLEIEFVCSDSVEHRRRVEARHGADARWPSWQDVVNRDYRAWHRERLVIDTATMTVEQAAAAIINGGSLVNSVETERLLLRIPVSRDAAPLRHIHEDPKAIARIQFVALPGGLSTAWRNVTYLVGHWHVRGFGEWTIVEKRTDEIIGRVGFSYPDGAEAPELGWIIRSDLWGRRFASEAARAALDWLWLNTEFSSVISTINLDNAPSIRIAKRLGGVEESQQNRGKVDSVIYRYARPRTG